MLGAAHPALLCAALYGNRLRAWKDAETIAEGILEIEPLGIGDRQDEGGGAGGFGVEPLARIEAWRLLARCRGAQGNEAGACEALECAVSESQTVGFLWMEAHSLKNLAKRVEGDEVALARVTMQIAAAESEFRLE